MLERITKLMNDPINYGKWIDGRIQQQKKTRKERKKENETEKEKKKTTIVAQLDTK